MEPGSSQRCSVLDEFWAKGGIKLGLTTIQFVTMVTGSLLDVTQNYALTHTNRSVYFPGSDH